jgi:DNA primase small subunit
MRYLCYKNKDQFKKDLLRKMPEKVDFGGVYNASPTLRDSVKDFQPESKELVFDIDMTDYDDVRNCCEGAAICQRCWQLMTCAVKVLDAALREDFGFNHLLWVFSGRRGIHCWISDERARYLKQAEREAIVSYLSVYMGTDKNRTVDVGYGAHMHPTLHRAFETLLPIFEQFILPEQGLLESEDSCEEFLSFIDAKERSYFQWEDMDVAPEVKWEELKKLVQTHVRQKGKRANNSVRHVIAKIVFYYTYPRLDIGVSKHLNHLLKSPFSVHPKTGNVCVPMLAKDIDVFNPFQVPTLAQLHEQLNAAVTDDLQLKMYERTSLKPYVEMLQDYVLGLENEKRAQKAKAKANRGGNTGVETMDF